jgi:fimbrial chaperone protein
VALAKGITSQASIKDLFETLNTAELIVGLISSKREDRRTSMKYRTLLLTCGWLSLCPAWAINVSPITAELDFARQRTGVITVINPGAARPLPIKVSVKTWSMDSAGTDRRGATDDILVFPGQFVLAPTERRSVRLAARYKDKPDVERTYRVIVQELPIDLEGQTKQKTGVKLVTSYAIALYVRPNNPESRLLLTGVERRPDGLLFTIRNEGNAHSHLRKLTLRFTQGAKMARVDDPKQLPRFLSENLLAGSERHFTWRWPADIKSVIDSRQPFNVEVEVACESCDGGQTVLQFSMP